MRQSMTGYASGQGAGLGLSWSWDLRSVNARGLDLRIRVPDWIDGLEPALRKKLGERLARGSVTLSLRVQSAGADAALELNAAQMERVLDALSRIEAEAMMRGLSLTASSAADLLALRGVMDAPQDQVDPDKLRAALLEDVSPVLDSLIAAREAEGAALLTILSDQLDQLEHLTAAAARVAEERRGEQQDRLRAALARVTDTQDGIDEQRIAQELALIAVKADVTEEIDRLRAHIAAARDLLAAEGPVGRKLDFLMQEFNREANTLCSKAQSSDLTAVGLDLKSVIEQMREQVQNVE
ncbi:YicC/YloC family endoribonuclease [Marivita sp. GX14005]|uniref:YicC/YloC family endoribonuclease n=1 Tax=Marivita sp. GX14005 TaxID=2942276 RepID=UPI0020187541|nr:YicC/YloC family endoribonuclease [Marivita sp. GX14005]MCL3882653.1 YicC family protein [Marivita sp. GX14005]